MTSTAIKLPSFRLDGKRALVTGAGRGIGAASAEALAGAGAAVTLVSRSLDEVQSAANAIRDAGGIADARRLDVTDSAVIAEFAAAEAPFDILVNNAGMNRPAPFLEVKEADFDAILGLNLRAAFFVSQAVIRRRLEVGGTASVIHISSQMGHVGAANRSVYCASKFALEGMTKSMAIDLAPYGVRVNTLCPTFIETPMTSGFLQDLTFRTDVLQKIKLGRLARIEDVLGGLIYLACDASSMVTGTSILIDGGWTAD